MSDNDLLDTYTELFVMYDEDDNQVPAHFECSQCERDVTDDPCPEHAPTDVPGLRLVECQSQPKHQLWVLNRDDYGYGCPECRLIPYLEAETAARQCRHRAWRRTRFAGWLSGAAYVLGVFTGGGVSWGDGHDACHSFGRLRGHRSYILGVSRDTWRCWLKGRHRRGEDTGVFGFCGRCLPCDECGSETLAHRADCPYPAGF